MFSASCSRRPIIRRGTPTEWEAVELKKGRISMDDTPNTLGRQWHAIRTALAVSAEARTSGARRVCIVRIH